jgi:hypothetical protein
MVRFGMSNPNETMKTTKKNYYAFNYPCGLAVSSTGGRYGLYHAFESKRERDDYVAKGNEYSTGADYREAISTSDPELRSALRAADALMESGSGWVESRWDANIYIH